MMTGWSITLRAARTRNYTVSCAQVSFLIALSMITACQSAPPPEKKNTVELTLIAGLNMNPNRRGVASPLKVTVYALNDDEAFLDAGFLTITESPDPELKKEMQQLWEGILRPGEKKQVTVVTDDTAHVLGIVAAYRDIQKAQWSASSPLPEKPSVSWYQALWPWHTEAPAQPVEITFDKLNITIKGLNRENE
ncbi:type VI secretion system lipoprotein TssJ [Cronobacter sakazakii]|uniref:type VI secretion system lipoprotein TssJ n=1 Tax=Cronobacter sakazakii TaxID=28141 RepID=UPI001F300510|nr:type VI secretion system lipoprotein TssJ [Cronobacter sakazakii]MDI7682067.1 type VI secretion system lipoprotein TssJ [Cronobacter sakazakii]MDK1242088.1 type VI secretion system lipoprotein TssJ [Cronobacter sakazakii]MDT3618035.1 type VI secretion system lipoprotein TssJ [Cronobacter sakazakii]